MSIREADRLRDALARAAREGRGRGYPASLRAEVARYAGAQAAAGEGGTITARALGINTATLASWVARHRGAPPSFARVEIVDAPASPAGTKLIVFGPHGLRIEGLDLEGIASLLRRLA
ncbi:MAG: hypothetical protein U1E65_36660 [Myxococcota bacterium]